LDIAGATKSEVFRPIATIAIPGAIAVAPYVIIVQHYIPRVLEFWKEHDTAFSAIVVACVLAAGLLLEDLGAILESQVLDRLLDKRHPGHRDNWDRYLQLRIKDEFVGQRYLRTMVTHLKFELAMLPSILCLWVGLLWVEVLHDVWKGCGFLLLSLFLLAVSVYLAVESYFSARTLGSTRKLLLAATSRDPNPALSRDA
jgi:hypothetical protein